MPRIIKNRDDNMITNSVLDEELNDFLHDPELFRDLLPQPYRRIDRVLDELLDETWTIIENNENEKKLENAKYRPNKINKMSIVEGLDSFNCICASSDENNEFIFTGSDGFLTAVDSVSMDILDKFDIIDPLTQTKEGTNIISVASSRFNNQVHFVVSISDAGTYFKKKLLVKNSK